MKKHLIITSALALGLTFSLNLNAQDYSKSSKEWNRNAFKKVETHKDMDVLPKDSQIAMACSKCKSMTMITKKELGTKPGHGTTQEVTSVDKCPGCGGKITTKSTGKESHYVHTCSECGDDSAYCCATTPGEKSEGMQK